MKWLNRDRLRRRKIEKVKKYAAPVIVVVVAIIVCISVISFTESFENGGLKGEKNTIDWNQQMISENEGLPIKFQRYGDIFMKQGTNFIDMYLVNPVGNPCYFEYIFLIKDTGKEIYHSNLIEPGKALKKIRLKEVIQSGEYDIQIKVNTYSLNDKSMMNNAVVETKLIAG